jgi:hypothetical protein
VPETPANKTNTGTPLAQPTPVRSAAEITAIVGKAEKGDPAALAELREWVAIPGSSDLLGGNVAREALELLVKQATGGNVLMRLATLRKFDEMRAELLGPNPTALERLLVERIVATWFHLHYLEARFASAEHLTLAQGLYYQRCLAAAQKRYLAAIRGLADVRRLALPALQVNIAKKQVNVAGAPIPAS